MSASAGNRWYGPDDPWPDHPKPWFRQVLMLARGRGWWYKAGGSSAHSHAIVYCERPAPGRQPCKYTVFSSGRSGESASGELARRIQQCPHSQDNPDDLLTQIAGRIDKIEGLATAAALLLERYEREQDMAALLDRAQELIELATDGTEEVEGLLSEAIDVEIEAKAAAEEAEAALKALGTEVRDPALLVDTAEEAAREVRTALLAIEPPKRAAHLRSRLKTIQADLRILRSRLPE